MIHEDLSFPKSFDVIDRGLKGFVLSFNTINGVGKIQYKKHKDMHETAFYQNLLSSTTSITSLYSGAVVHFDMAAISGILLAFNIRMQWEKEDSSHSPMTFIDQQIEKERVLLEYEKAKLTEETHFIEEARERLRLPKYSGNGGSSASARSSTSSSSENWNEEFSNNKYLPIDNWEQDYMTNDFHQRRSSSPHFKHVYQTPNSILKTSQSRRRNLATSWESLNNNHSHLSRSGSGVPKRLSSSSIGSRIDLSNSKPAYQYSMLPVESKAPFIASGSLSRPFMRRSRSPIPDSFAQPSLHHSASSLDSANEPVFSTYSSMLPGQYRSPTASLKRRSTPEKDLRYIIEERKNDLRAQIEASKSYQVPSSHGYDYYAGY